MNKDIKYTYRKAYFTGEYDFNNDFINEELKFKDEKNEVIIIIILKKVFYKILNISN